MRFSLRTLLIAVAICAVIVLGGIWGVRKYYAGVDDWVPAYPVLTYMENHDGHWPPNWAALRTEIEGDGSVYGWSFEKYRSRVDSDFDVDPTDLSRQAIASDRPTFDVIRVTDVTGRRTDNVANQMVYNYFRSKAKEAGSTK
jgi:hypothetical protein